MISTIATFSATPTGSSEVRRGLEELVEHARTEPGTLVYVLQVDASDDTVFTMYELYGDADAAAAHAGSDIVKRVIPSLVPLLREPIRIARGTVALASIRSDL